jgi:hypothetical protein
MIGAACREGWPTLFHRLPEVILRLVSPLGGGETPQERRQTAIGALPSLHFTNILTSESLLAGIGRDKGAAIPELQTVRQLTVNTMIRSDVLYMIKRRAKGAALPLLHLLLSCFSRTGLRLILETVPRSNSKIMH